jgi:tetratricopeptide (TPR) repeat protein
MFFPILLTLQAAPQAAEPARYATCMNLATSDAAKGVAEATAWRLDGGGMFARQCLGVAYANQQRWESAAGAFEEAAREAQTAGDARAANYWAQAGNAWLAGGQPAKARAALDAAMADGRLTGLPLGEAHLDRARAMVPLGDLEGARAELDRAIVHAPADPLAWLLSATLARRQGDLKRAATDITQALKLSGDDASVQLEAGNVAAAQGNEADARTAWTRVIELSPGSPQANAARGALGQFGAAQN